MVLKYLNTSLAFINTGMKDRSVAYSRPMDENWRQDFGLREVLKIQCVPSECWSSDCTTLSCPNLHFSFLSYIFLSPLASITHWEMCVCGWSPVRVGPSSQGSAASPITWSHSKVCQAIIWMEPELHPAYLGKGEPFCGTRSFSNKGQRSSCCDRGMETSFPCLIGNGSSNWENWCHIWPRRCWAHG